MEYNIHTTKCTTFKVPAQEVFLRIAVSIHVYPRGKADNPAAPYAVGGE